MASPAPGSNDPELRAATASATKLLAAQAQAVKRAEILGDVRNWVRFDPGHPTIEQEKGVASLNYPTRLLRQEKEEVAIL